MNELIMAMAIDEQERDCPDERDVRDEPCRCGAPACTAVEPAPWLS
jgi:hypothetical protein